MVRTAFVLSFVSMSRKQRDSSHHTVLSKKDKMSHCMSISEVICSPQLSSMEDFQKFLGIVVETLLFYCDDEEADVRIKAGECLSRVMRSLMDGHSSRILIELYKEIKKNSSPRPLRIALSRFGDLCHLIRLSKRRAYLTNLLPCILKVIQTRKDDESVIETLSMSVPKIFGVFGRYTADGEVTTLIKTFLDHCVIHRVASIRRYGALCIASIIEESRKPGYFLSLIIKTLVGMCESPSNVNQWGPTLQPSNEFILPGVFVTLKGIIPLLSTTDVKPEAKDNLIFLYELILHTIRWETEQVTMMSALECLSQLLKSPPKIILPILLSSEGIRESKMESLNNLNLSIVASPNGVRRSHSSLSSSSFRFSSSIQSADLEEEDELVIRVNLPEPVIEVFEKEDSTGTHSPVDGTATSGKEPDLETGIEIEEDRTPTENSKEGKDDSTSLISSCSSRSTRTLLDKTVMQLTYLESQDSIDRTSPSPEPSPSTPSITVTNSQQDIPKIRKFMETNLNLIGSFTDPCPHLDYCTRLVVSSFLLCPDHDGTPLQIPDTLVRVSVKFLAMGCVASLVSISPQTFLLDILKEKMEGGEDDPSSPSMTSTAKIYDVIKYSSHSDPVLRSSVSAVISTFIWSVLSKHDSFSDFLLKYASPEDISTVPSVEDLLVVVRTLLTSDASPMSIKNTLISLQYLLPMLLTSSEFLPRGIELIRGVLKLSNHSYWLIKVELMNLLSKVDYRVTAYSESVVVREIEEAEPPIQERVIEMFLSFLSDQDNRIRASAVNNVIPFVKALFFPSTACPSGDPVTGIAFEEVARYLGSFTSLTSRPVEGCGLLFPSRRFPSSMVMWPEPFTDHDFADHSNVESVFLERKVNMLSHLLQNHLTSHLDSKATINGCLACLDSLVTRYPPTSFANVSTDDSFLHFLSSFLVSSSPHSVVLDVISHGKCISLLSTLLASRCYDVVREVILSAEETTSSVEGCEFGVISRRRPDLTLLLELLIAHNCRLLYLASCIVRGQKPSMDGPTKDKDRSFLLGKIRMRKLSNNNNDQPVMTMDNLSLDDSHMKLYDLLKSSHDSFRISGDFTGEGKFVQFIEIVLKSLSQLIEMATISFLGRKVDILLEMMGHLLPPCPKQIIQLTQILLRGIFGVNFGSILLPDKKVTTPDDGESGATTNASMTMSTTSLSSSVMTNFGLYQVCFSDPYTRFSVGRGSQGSRLLSPTHGLEWHEQMAHFTCLMRRNMEQRVSTLLTDKMNGTSETSTSSKTSNKEESAMSSYIKLFEPLVIKSLKMYTTSSNMIIQGHILNLVSTLLHVRVNYALLDSDQVFLEFVLKQFDNLPSPDVDGIELQNMTLLFERIFYFLCLLSHEKIGVASRSPVIPIPRVIQLTDNLLASGVRRSLVVSCLRHLVNELFVLRGHSSSLVVNKSPGGHDSLRELDTQREVVLATLLKNTLDDPSAGTIDLLLTIVHVARRDSEEKWKKTSRIIIDFLLPHVNRISENVDNFDKLQLLFESVSPMVFRPVDLLLRAFKESTGVLSSSLVLLRIILTQTKEDVLLQRVEKVFGSSPVTTLRSESKESISGEDIFSRMLMDLVVLAIEKLVKSEDNQSVLTKSLNHQVTLTCHLFLYLTYMFLSGMFRRVTKSMSTLVKVKSPRSPWSLLDINDKVVHLSKRNPLLSLQWTNILLLLGVNEEVEDGRPKVPLFSQLIGESEWSISASMSPSLPISPLPPLRELVRRGVIILLCDFAAESTVSNAELMTWLIVNHIYSIISLSQEVTITDFIHAIHRNPSSASLFIQSIDSRCPSSALRDSTFVSKMVSALTYIHPKASGSLISLLIEKVVSNPEVKMSILPSILATAESLALDRLTMTLKSESVEELKSQLSLEEVGRLLGLSGQEGEERSSALVTTLERYQRALETGKLEEEKSEGETIPCDNDDKNVQSPASEDVQLSSETTKDES